MAAEAAEQLVVGLAAAPEALVVTDHRLLAKALVAEHQLKLLYR